MDKTYAFIDSQNLHLSILNLGWKLDFQCLAKYLHEQGKLGALLIPNQGKYSALLKFKVFKPYLKFVSDLKTKLELK